MKSRFKYLPLFLLLASCSVEQVPQAGQESPEAVTLGTLVSRPQVKGVGPVDAWKTDMQLYIYGIQRLYENEQSSPNILDFHSSEEGKCFIDNVMVYAPADGTQRVRLFNKPADEEPFFYQEGRRYEFFGYYTDGAATDIPTTREFRIDVPVKIDGTQDVMCAVTDKTADLAGRTFSETRLYSAYSARHGVVPRLRFGHELSRFNFYVTGVDGLSDIVTLTRLQVESKTTGTLVIANKDCNDAPGLDMETLSAPEWFFAINDKAQRITRNDDIHPRKDHWDYIGSIMVMPGEPVYNFLLGIIQEGFSDHSFPSYNPEFDDVESSFSIDFQDLQNYSEDPKYGGDTSKDVENLDSRAVKGHQYDVNIVVYGLQQVRVNVTLTPWEDGGSIVVDQDPMSGTVNLEILNVEDMELQKGHITGLMPVAKVPVWNAEKHETEYKDFDGELRYSFESADPSIVETDSSGMINAKEIGETKVLITVVSAEEGKAKGRRTIKVKVTE